MTDTLLLASRAVFALAGFAVGFRLAQMAHREAGVPTHAWASAIIFVGGLGLVGYALGPLLAPLDVGLATVTLAASDGLERIALVGLGGFLWKVFGPASWTRGLAFGLIALGLGVDWLLVLRHQHWPDTGLPLPLASLTHLAFALPLGWSTLESGLQHRRSNRQLAIGLADPVVAHRFLLWTIGSGALAAICVLAALGEALPASSVWAEPLALARAVLHLGSAGAVVLGFFPPKAYERWLVERAAEGG